VTHQEAIDTLASERYLLDEMSGEDRQAFEEHFFSCEACADDLRAAAAMLEGAKSGLAGRISSGRVIPMAARSAAGPRAWYRSTALPWTAAAALAGVAVYQSVRVAPPTRDASPVALAPVALHPATRGAEATVYLEPNAHMVSLALDVNDAPAGAQLAYQLATPEGRTVASGRASAPEPGTPLLLLLPTSTLAAPMHYVLSVRDTGAQAQLLGEYRFALTPR